MPQDLADAVFSHPFVQAAEAAPKEAQAADMPVALAITAPLPLPVSSYADPDAARKAITLKFPVLFPAGAGTQQIDTVFLRKLTVGQIRAVQANYALAKQADPAAEPDFQIVVDRDGNPVPKALLDLLEADDADMLDEAILDFLPRRFRA